MIPTCASDASPGTVYCLYETSKTISPAFVVAAQVDPRDVSRIVMAYVWKGVIGYSLSWHQDAVLHVVCDCNE